MSEVIEQMENIEIETEESKTETLRAERVEEYKATQRYLQSEEYSAIVDKFRKDGEEMLPIIRNEIETREKVETTKSEADKVLGFVKFMEEVLSMIGDSEGGKVFKEIISGQIEAGWSHVDNKIMSRYNEEDEFSPLIPFDAPVYSKLDLMKQARIDRLRLDSRMEGWSDSFSDPKAQQIPSAHPYEE